MGVPKARKPGMPGAGAPRRQDDRATAEDVALCIRMTAGSAFANVPRRRSVRLAVSPWRRRVAVSAVVGRYRGARGRAGCRFFSNSARPRSSLIQARWRHGCGWVRLSRSALNYPNLGELARRPRRCWAQQEIQLTVLCAGGYRTRGAVLGDVAGRRADIPRRALKVLSSRYYASPEAVVAPD